MNRRGFVRRMLQLAGGALGLGAVGGVGLWRAQPRRRRLPPHFADDVSRPEQLGAARKVVVVGGGLAGLTSAIELARRHFSVTLVERAPQLGGKLAGWSIDVLGERFPVEHAFHGFYAQYYNLNALLTEAGCDRDLRESQAHPLLFADRPEEALNGLSSIFPVGILQMLHRSPSLGLRDGLAPGLRELARYDPERTFRELDSTDFASYLRAHDLHGGVAEALLLPFARGTLNRPERLSAAEALRFFHFYFVANPEGLASRYLGRSSHEAVIEPLRRLFESLGGVVRTGTTARRLVREGNAITQVVVDADPPPTSVARVAPGEVPETGYRRVALEDGTPLFVARRQGRFVAFDGRCTHMGCPIDPDPENPTAFKCPCHGGRFDSEGEVVRGPPERPLRRVPVVENTDGTLSVGGTAAASSGSALPCDHCVLACEVRGAKQLVAASSLGEPQLEQQMRALGEADPYVVMRVWLDKPVRADRQPFYAVARYRYINAVALYSQFQEPFADWAQRTRGAVVELQAFAVAPEDLAAPMELRARLLEELQKVLPELAGAQVLHLEYLQQDNFTRWAPGDSSSRPETQTALSNFVLAGDWVKLPIAAALMEAAVVSGKLAANAVLDREGLRETPIDAVPAKGPLG